MKRFVGVAAVAAFVMPVAQAVVFPTGAHAAYNNIPFSGVQTATHHQVFASSLFTANFGGSTLISEIGFCTNPLRSGQSATMDLTVRWGYTNKIPGATTAAGGLDSVLANNPTGSMATVFSNSSFSFTMAGATASDFMLRVPLTPFVYDPSQGNLLLEFTSINATTQTIDISRTAGSAESSRAYNSSSFGNTASNTTAIRIDFVASPVPEPCSMLAIGVGVAALAARRRNRG